MGESLSVLIYEDSSQRIYAIGVAYARHILDEGRGLMHDRYSVCSCIVAITEQTNKQLNTLNNLFDVAIYINEAGNTVILQVLPYPRKYNNLKFTG